MYSHEYGVAICIVFPVTSYVFQDVTTHCRVGIYSSARCINFK